jgi:hypothetical protein
LPEVHDRIRWPDGKVRCAHCQSERVTYLATARVWKCYAKHPRAKFSRKVGTVFEDSPISLNKWFCAMSLVVNRKNGVSSYEIARDLKVTQKTAWFMDHRIRLAMQSGSFEKVSGEFGVDKSFIGGSARFMHKSKRDEIAPTSGTGKAVVMGLLDRKTKKMNQALDSIIARRWTASDLPKRWPQSPGSESRTRRLTGKDEPTSAAG